MSLASVSYTTAKSLLNDSTGSIWTDALLTPFFNEGYRELQTKLKDNDCPIQTFTEAPISVAIAATTITITSKIIEPIKVWEKAVGALDSTYTPVTEFLNLPDLVSATTIQAWRWSGTTIQILPPSTNRVVRVKMFIFNDDITTSAANIPFINNENYLGPRLASLAAKSIGETDAHDTWKALADSNLMEVVKSNRGINAANKFRP